MRLNKLMDDSEVINSPDQNADRAVTCHERQLPPPSPHSGQAENTGRFPRAAPLRATGHLLFHQLLYDEECVSVGWCRCCFSYSHTAITALHPPVTSTTRPCCSCFLAALHLSTVFIIQYTFQLIVFLIFMPYTVLHFFTLVNQQYVYISRHES